MLLLLRRLLCFVDIVCDNGRVVAIAADGGSARITVIADVSSSLLSPAAATAVTDEMGVSPINSFDNSWLCVWPIVV